MNRKNGFTLFETMVAVAIIGMSVPVVISLGSMVFKTVFKATHSFEHVIGMQNMLIEAHENKWWESGKKETRHNEFPAMTLTYSTKPVSDKSALKAFKNIVIERIEARWHDGGRERSDSLVFFMYKPEKKDSDRRLSGPSAQQTMAGQGGVKQ